MRPNESFIAQPVRSLQTMLRVIQEDGGHTESIVPDGIYGTSTMQAVSAFQQEHGLPVTGVADQTTWELIVEAYSPALVRTDSAEPLKLILNPNQVIHRGQSHPYLYLVQSMLVAFSEIYSSVPMPQINGVLDIATTESIAAFQYLSGLPQTGEVDKVTWKHIALQYPLAVNHQQSRNKIQR